jgi:ppGpp synthetase/RelA/SpoT-type nucleotidyltranferase
VSSLSKTQIDKLGDRLRVTGLSAEDDARKLSEFVAGNDPVRIEVEQGLRSLVGETEFINARLKTAASILDKLRRQHDKLRGQHMKLADMQDVVGARVVTSGGWKRQDELVLAIGQRWQTHKVVDRREKPQHGYRAVHVIIKSRGRSIEVQVRTAPQQRWAELFEKLADQWGRQIRYGAPPNEPVETRAEVIRLLNSVSDSIADCEHAEVLQGEGVVGDSLARLQTFLDSLDKELLKP